MLALNQMEKAYLDGNGRTLEIEKTVSLLQLNPRAVLDLIETGECVFELPEKLFSDDFPGHYLRKIKTVAVSIPAVTGPYQNLHGTLTQLSNQVIVKPDLNAINYLLGASDASMPDSSSCAATGGPTRASRCRAGWPTTACSRARPPTTATCPSKARARSLPGA